MIGPHDQRRTRRWAVASVLATALGLAAATAAPVASATTISLVNRTLLGTQSHPSYKPKSVTVVQNGLTYVITGIRWRHWNSGRAVGRGRGRVGGFVARATLVATGRSYCTTVGAFVYDDLQMTLGARRG